jgi:hypothetical protein
VLFCGKLNYRFGKQGATGLERGYLSRMGPEGRKGGRGVRVMRHASASDIVGIERRWGERRYS